MPRKPRTPRIVKHKLSPDEIAYLTDAVVEDEGFTLWCYRREMPGFDHEPKPREVWERHREEFLPAFIREHPGRRPLPWWQWDAPTEAAPGWSEFQVAQRRRLGGTGTPLHEVSASWGGFTKGIPNSWAGAEHFGGVAIDPAHPPTFESEAAYLRRRRLLTADERAHLAKHPALLDPEVVVFDDDEDPGAGASLPDASRRDRGRLNTKFPPA
ncbi:MAG: hypothetical protein WCI75_08645 [candidate division NC10 bacterium]